MGLSRSRATPHRPTLLDLAISPGSTEAKLDHKGMYSKGALISHLNLAAIFRKQASQLLVDLSGCGEEGSSQGPQGTKHLAFLFFCPSAF